MEYLIDQVNEEKVSLSHRMDMFFVSGLKPKWSFKQTLADQKLNLGLVKGALDLYLSLHNWEDVILCYTILGLKHKVIIFKNILHLKLFLTEKKILKTLNLI